jgi:hypothetical protein
MIRCAYHILLSKSLIKESFAKERSWNGNIYIALEKVCGEERGRMNSLCPMEEFNAACVETLDYTSTFS